VREPADGEAQRRHLLRPCARAGARAPSSAQRAHLFASHVTHAEIRMPILRPSRRHEAGKGCSRPAGGTSAHTACGTDRIGSGRSLTLVCVQHLSASAYVTAVDTAHAPSPYARFQSHQRLSPTWMSSLRLYPKLFPNPCVTANEWFSKEQSGSYSHKYVPLHAPQRSFIFAAGPCEQPDPMP
jgi:hypothetical protein